MIKLGQMVLKKFKWVHNAKIRSCGLEEVNWVHIRKLGQRVLKRFNWLHIERPFDLNLSLWPLLTPFKTI